MLWWPELGFIALLLALCVSLLTALLSLAGGGPWAQRLPALCPRRWSLAQLALTAVGFVLLLLALLADDFSLRYVAQHSHSALARGLKLAAAWAATRDRCCCGCCVWRGGAPCMPCAPAVRRRRRTPIPWG